MEAEPHFPAPHGPPSAGDPTKVLQRLSRYFGDPKIEQIVAQASSQKKFHGEVKSPLAFMRLVRVMGAFPTFHQSVTQRDHQRLIGVMRRNGVFIAASV